MNHNIVMERGFIKMKDWVKERNEEIVSLYRSPMTLQEIGDQMGLTRERVRQILVKNGVKKEEGGDSVKSKYRQKEKSLLDAERAIKQKAIRDKRHEKWVKEHLSATVEELESVGLPHTRENIVCHNYVAVKFAREYHDHHPFLSYMDWIKVWRDSGHFNMEEGSEHGWCLSRKDTGKPWSIENAKIIRSGSWLTGRPRKKRPE